jgi:hypothetical protein
MAQVPTSITLKTTVTDNVGVTRVDVLVNDAVMASRTSPPFDFPLVLKAGQQQIKVVGHDAWGNKGEASVTVSAVGGSVEPTAPTAGAGLFGDPCSGPTSCASGMCAVDAATGQQFCTQACGPALGCPSWGECATTSNGSQVCVPGSSQGGAKPAGKTGRVADSMSCSLAASPADGLGTFAPLLALLALLRRRSLR